MPLRAHYERQRRLRISRSVRSAAVPLGAGRRYVSQQWAAHPPPTPTSPRPAQSPPPGCWTSNDRRRRVVCRTPPAGVGRQISPESQRRRRICPYGHTTNARGDFESRGAFVVTPSPWGQEGVMFLCNGRRIRRRRQRRPARHNARRGTAGLQMTAGDVLSAKPRSPV